MRRIVSSLVVIAVIASLCTAAMAEDKPAEKKKKGCKAVELFNGKCLAGWECFSVDPDVKMEDIWSVKDGNLVCKGEPLGYLYTKKDYQDYKLIVVWRWAPGAEPGNNGILLRITGDSLSFLPKCAECQLRHGSAGDLYGFYGRNIKGDEERFKVIEHAKLGKLLAVGKIENAEKEPGQWNKAKITVKGGNITVVINGKKVNEATDVDVVPGRIGLQSEGGEIHFRSVKLVPLKAEKK